MTPRRIDLDAAREAEEAMARIAGGKPLSAEVLTRLKGLPALLRTSGLPATLAFFAAKSGEKDLGRAYKSVRQCLLDQLRAELGWDPTPPDIYSALADLPPVDLGRAQLRVGVFAGWLRRLAEAAENDQAEKARQENSSTDGTSDA